MMPSSVISSLDSTAAEYSRRLSRIHSYLQYKRVPSHLSRRVMRYYRFMWSSLQSLDEAKILPDLPPPLKMHEAVAILIRARYVLSPKGLRGRVLRPSAMTAWSWNTLEHAMTESAKGPAAEKSLYGHLVAVRRVKMC